MTYPKFDLGPRNFFWLLSARHLLFDRGYVITGLGWLLCSWMSAFSVHPDHFGNELPSWDPFWSGILTFLFPADLALRRCHGTLVLDGLVYILILTVLNLADRSSLDPIFMDLCLFIQFF